tara:strand:+ start:675 stop:1283 length:609 start_codon:yes stop_codon:yes gene_type:complete
MEKTDSDKIISNFTSLDYVVLSCMHYTDLKVMIKINPLDLVVSCEKLFDCEFMKKMNGEPSSELKLKIQNWLNSIEYKQYTQNTAQSLGANDKQRIRNIYAKLGLKPHDLSELTDAGIKFLESKEFEIKQKWDEMVQMNISQDAINLKKSIDEYAALIPLMFTTGIANGQLFSAMFKTVNLGMYDYLSKNPLIHPIFLDYLK